MSSKSAAQRSSPTKRSDNRQRIQPILRQAMGGGSPNPAEMQKRLGNQGTQAWLAKQQIQPKLTIGQPGDQQEQEADRTADAVMRMPNPGPPGDEETKHQTKPQLSMLQRSNLSTTTENRPIQRLCIECEKELGGQSEQKLQRKENDEQTPHVTQDVEANINALDGKGSPLPDSTRNYFEPRFGVDFSQVRVHTGTQAAETAKSINAKAFTIGNNIVFGSGQFAPNSHEGQKLMGHELTHVVQQSGSTVLTREGSSGFLSRSIITAAPPCIQPDWLDDAEAAVSDTYDSVASTVGDAYDSVTSAVSEVTEEVADEVEAAVTTVSNAGQDAYDLAKETGEEYISALLEEKKASLLEQINGALQKVSGLEFVAFTDNQIATLNNYLTALSEKSQGSINLPGIAVRTDSMVVPGNKLVGASTIKTLLLNLQSSISALLISSNQAVGVYDSEIVQGNIQRAVAAPPLVGAGAGGVVGGPPGAVIGFIIGIIVMIVMLIWAAILIAENAEKDKEKEREREEKEKEEEEKKRKKEEKEKDKKKCTKAFFWDPIRTAPAAGSLPGILEPCFGLPDVGFVIIGHHSWPKYAGGLGAQPLLGMRASIHYDVIHPLLDVALLSAFGKDGLTRNTSLNGPFFARLRADRGLRRQMAAALSLFYAGFSAAQCDPGIPPTNYEAGIGATLVSLGGP